MSTARKFSFLYTEIVEDENDMIGHIAYSLYKTSKIEFIKNFKKNNDERLPTEQELETFHLVSSTNIPAFRIHAEQVLSNFTDITLRESIEEIEIQMLTTQQQILTDIIAPIIPPPSKGPWAGFGMAVIVKCAQALVVAIIFFFIIFGVSATEDFWGTLRRIIPESHKTITIQTNDTIK